MFAGSTFADGLYFIHSPMKIDTAPSISSFQLSYRSLLLANFQSKNNIDPLCNLDLKS